MKKRLPLLLAGLGLIGIAASSSSSVIRADAGARANIVVNDTFNDAQFRGSHDSTKWEVEGTGFAQSVDGETYLWNKGGPGHGGDQAFFGTDDVVTGLTEFKFDFLLGAKKWVGLKFHAQKVGSAISSWDVNFYTAPITFSKDSTITNVNLYPDQVGGGFTLEAAPGYTNAISSFIGINDIVDTKTWISCKLVPVTAWQAKFYIARQGEVFNDAAYLTIGLPENGSQNFKNCQIAFQSEGPDAKFGLDNIVLKADGINVDEKFIDFIPEDSVLGTTNREDNSVAEPFAVTGISTLVAKEGATDISRIVSKGTIEEDTSIATEVEVINASFNIKFLAQAAIDDTVVFAAGLRTKNAAIDTAAITLSVTKVKAILKINDGQSVKETTVNVTGLTSTEGVTFTVSVIKSGNVTVTASTGAVLTADGCTSYAGKVAFTIDGILAKDVAIDNVKVINSTYYVPVTKSVTHNFSNDFWGNEGYEDFYLDNRNGAVSVADGELVYTGASDETFFGSNHQYDQFILDYKLTSIYVGTPDMESNQRTAEHKWLGLDLSRNTPGLMNYGNYAMLLLEITPSESSDIEYVQFYQNSESPLVREDLKQTYHKPVPTSLFKNIQYNGTSVQKSDIKASDAVCFRWISNGTSIELWLKTAGQAEFTKYYTLSDIELAGYFAICQTGFAYITLDDFSMANTSPIYVCADNEAPETVVETETVVIYDPSAGENINLDEEILLNACSSAGCGGSIIAASAITSLVACGALALLLLKRKEK